MEFTDQEAFGYKLHDFQVQIKNIFKINEDCLLINAPTGTGKTFAFILPTATSNDSDSFRRKKSLIITPSNFLISQTYLDIEETIHNNLDLKDIRIAKIHSSEFSGLKRIERANRITNEFSLKDIIISNPDMISLFLSGFYYLDYKNEEDVLRHRNTVDIFSQINLIIFDEFHMYTEEELGKIFAFLLLSKLIANGKIPKLIFTSATPNFKIKEMLELIGVKYREENAVPSLDGTENSRCIRGKIEFNVTSSGMLETLDSLSKTCRKRENKVLYLFDHKIDAERARNILIQNGISGDDIAEITGYANRSNNRIQKISDEKFILATNAAEQGLNLDVSEAHIEIGLYKENFVQRYGRIGRAGKDGKITIHVSEPFEKLMPETAIDFNDFISKIDEILIKRDVYISRIKRHFASFLALVTLRGVNTFSYQIKKVISKLNDKGISKVYDSILGFDAKLGQISGDECIDMNDLQDLRQWWGGFLLSIGFFRGESTNVVVEIVRPDQRLKTTEDIMWLKKWCEYEKKREEKQIIYEIKKFREIPRSIEIEYKVAGYSLKVNELELNDRKKFSDKYLNKLIEFIRNSFDCSKEEVDQIIDKLSIIVDIIFPRMLKPKEVENATEII